jgi:predicted PurR-regulated permease PerM
VSRLSGDRGRRLVGVAATTMRGVVYGIIGTAIAQGVAAGIGFLIAGVPAAPLLGLATFFLSPVPIGPPLVWIPAAIWLFYHGSTGWAIFMAIWGVAVVSSVDNVIKPLIISRGSNLPFILVLLGVLGGVVAFGFIGLFLGPTLLAIGYVILQEWNAAPKAAAAD